MRSDFIVFMSHFYVNLDNLSKGTVDYDFLSNIIHKYLYCLRKASHYEETIY